MKKNKAVRIFFKSRARSFKYAFRGYLYVLKTQQNAWIHLGATIITVLVSFWLRISKTDWIAILLVIGIVWIAEFLNTALEVIVDIASPEKHPLAKVGKDVGAAAVLIAAIIAVIVGVLVLGVPFLEKLSGH